MGVGRGKNPIWPTVVNTETAGTSLFAIPNLALALQKGKNIAGQQLDGLAEKAVGHVQFGSDLAYYPTAITAVAYLQTLTGRDFGYRRDGSAEDQAAAILKAHNWWRDEGHKKYTFDAIEAMLQKRPKEDRNRDAPN